MSVAGNGLSLHQKLFESLTSYHAKIVPGGSVYSFRSDNRVFEVLFKLCTKRSKFQRYGFLRCERETRGAEHGKCYEGSLFCIFLHTN